MSKPASLSRLAPPQVPNCLRRGAPRASLLRHHAPPGRGRSPSLNPGRGAQLGLQTLTPRGTSSLFTHAATRSRVLFRSLFPLLLSLPLFTSSLFSYLLPDPNLLSLAFCLATVLPPSPALSAPHLPELPLTFFALHWVPPAARLAQVYECAVDKRTGCARTPPPTPLSARSVATRSGLSSGDVPL